MESERFDRLSRALGRRLDRRRALGMGAALALGGVADAGAATCIAKGSTCRSGTCCAGLACDALVRRCRNARDGDPCRTSRECPGGSTCRKSVCQPTVVCRAAKQSCSTSSAGRRCCAGLACERSVCKGEEGATCASASDCVAGLICGRGTCRPSCEGTCPVGQVCTDDGDCVALMEVCDHTGMPGGTSTVYAACHIVREGKAAYVCQHSAKSRTFGVRTGSACAASADCRSWCTGQGYANCGCSLGERISNGAPRRNADFPDGVCVGWTGTFTAATINTCTR